MVQNPPSEEEGGAFVPLSKGLGGGDPEGQPSCHSHWIREVLNGPQRVCQALEIIGFIEPLVALADCLVDSDREIDRR